MADKDNEDLKNFVPGSSEVLVDSPIQRWKRENLLGSDEDTLAKAGSPDYDGVYGEIIPRGDVSAPEIEKKPLSENDVQGILDSARGESPVVQAGLDMVAGKGGQRPSDR